MGYDVFTIKIQNVSLSVRSVMAGTTDKPVKKWLNDYQFKSSAYLGGRGVPIAYNRG
jgi:hypothetical protein